MPEAFTCKYPGLASVLKSEIHVSQVNDSKKIFTSQAIWDTGATNCVITQAFAKAIGLVPISKLEVIGVHGSKEVDVYLIDLYLPNQVLVPAVRVTECASLPAGTSMLIGMDIIILGDFAISNYKGKTFFTFRIPSKNNFDFVPGAKIENEKQVKAEQRKNKRKK